MLYLYNLVVQCYICTHLERELIDKNNDEQVEPLNSKVFGKGQRIIPNFNNSVTLLIMVLAIMHYRCAAADTVRADGRGLVVCHS